ncbi:MAG: hypothetical protein ACSHXF_02820 [Aquaticitalea sp.]
MSNNLQEQNSEEIDLGQIFNAIGRLFDKFFRFVGSIFKGLFNAIILFLKIVIDYMVIVAVVVGLAFVIGYFLEKSKPEIYEASMLVKPYFDSKYQLVTNMSYYNSLLKEGNHEVLAETFNISEEEADKLVSFEVESGPETKNELLKQYDLYLRSLDSTRAQNITYLDFVENRDIYSSELFLVTVKSFQMDIFRKLEDGFNPTFSNRYSIDKKRIRDETLEMKKSVYQKDLDRMDTLQNVYIDIMKKESEKGSALVGLQGLLPLQQEKVKTYEYELIGSGMRIRDSIRKLDQMKIEEASYYDVLSRFPEVGNESTKMTQKFWFTFPIVAFLLLCFFYFALRTIKYIKNYEG